MPKTRQLSPKPGDVLVLAGTSKGLFVLRSDAKRKSWDVGGPHFPGQSVDAVALDVRGGRARLWAANQSHFGVMLRHSDDFGKTWSDPKEAPVKFPEDTGATVERVWQIRPGLESQPEVLWCGVAPAALFKSEDGGASWSLVRGLWDHPHRPKWEPGAGGLCLHTILPHPEDPQRMLIAISAAGVYLTDDGGKSWRASNGGVLAYFRPEPNPEFGQCVHKVARAAGMPERLYLQNHAAPDHRGGPYRSDDGGKSWTETKSGLPSSFGFALASHPHDADTAFVIPLEADAYRCTPEAKLRVYRTSNAGKSWQPMTKGLPQKDANETILRDAMTTDTLDPAGVFFGTRSGKVFGSADEGKSWRILVDGLPPVLCVRAVQVPGGKAKPSAKAKPSRRGARA